MKSNALEELYNKLSAVASPVPGLAQPAGIQREVGHFNVVNMEDLMRGYRNRPPMTFDRRPYYKISLVRGRSCMEYADQAIEVEHNALWFTTPKVPYRWLPHDLDQTGYFCLFDDDFLLPAKSGITTEELPLFQPGGCPVWQITDADYAAVETIFQRMTQEITSDYSYKYDLLRTYLWELIHLGQKLQPASTPAPAHSAATRLTAQFADLLERQFPLATPQHTLRLRTAKDYADQLAVHVNHLNRVLKETTGHTTTDLIGARVTQEAKMLLKHTSWTVSEIGDSLGFADVAHFCNFFKRQTSLAPGAFRYQGYCLNYSVDGLTCTKLS